MNCILVLKNTSLLAGRKGKNSMNAKHFERYREKSGKNISSRKDVYSIIFDCTSVIPMRNLCFGR